MHGKSERRQESVVPNLLCFDGDSKTVQCRLGLTYRVEGRVEEGAAMGPCIAVHD